MAPATVMPLQPAREKGALRMRLRQAFHRARSAIFPRRWLIPWEMSDNSRYYAQRRKQARASKASRDELESIEAEEAHFFWELQEELEMLESARLLSHAEKYMIPTPDFRPTDPNNPDSDPNWRLGISFKPAWYLKPQAMQELRTRIRAERKARREPVAEWVKIGGAVIGGIGGATYLVEKAIMLSHP